MMTRRLPGGFWMRSIFGHLTFGLDDCLKFKFKQNFGKVQLLQKREKRRNYKSVNLMPLSLQFIRKSAQTLSMHFLGLNLGSHRKKFEQIFFPYEL